jgi:hypothetical protein
MLKPPNRHRTLSVPSTRMIPPEDKFSSINSVIESCKQAEKEKYRVGNELKRLEQRTKKLNKSHAKLSMSIDDFIDVV